MLQVCFFFRELWFAISLNLVLMASLESCHEDFITLLNGKSINIERPEADNQFLLLSVEEQFLHLLFFFPVKQF